MPVYTEKVKDPKTKQIIDKTINGKKQYFIRTYVTDEFGNKKQITRHNKEWIGKDGQWKAVQEENRLKNNKINKHDKITLKQLIDEFLEYKKPMIKLSTYLKYKDDILGYIVPYFEYVIASKLNPNEILSWQNKINTLNLSIYTKKRIFTTFSSIMKYGCTFYGFEKNVITMVDNFKAPKGKNIKKINFLTTDEFDCFISFEKNKVYRDFFTILFYTGMRRGELLALSKDDIDFENNTITINKTYTPKYKKFGVEETDPKTNKSNRQLKMLNVVRNIFCNIELPDDGRIFDSVTLTTLKRKCDNNCAKAKIYKNIRIHDFRHSFASMCIENNVQIGIISEYLGHENISLTLDTYSHLYPNSQSKLLEKLNRI